MIPGCDRCEHGWVQVTPAYVERKAPWPAPAAAELMSEPGMQEAYDELVATVARKRASLAESYYPCRDCLPAAFYRWAQGHNDPNHDRANCPECRELDGRRGRGRASAPRRERDLLREGPSPVPVPAGAHRRDLDGPDDDDEKLWKG